MADDDDGGFLTHYRVLDCTDYRGHVRQRGVISAVALGHRQAAFAVMCSG